MLIPVTFICRNFFAIFLPESKSASLLRFFDTHRDFFLWKLVLHIFQTSKPNAHETLKKTENFWYERESE